jgi:glycosyltransferase involved in cell wall biosynthesis
MFSIGIPAYKAKDLKECIDSILGQTYKEFELIIVNDCSPEPLEEIINQYEDSRIKYYKNEKNFGAEHVVDNWNTCLSFATRDYFVLMGDDDIMAPNYLAEFKSLISAYPNLDIFHCRSVIINEFSVAIGITPINPAYEDVYDNMINCLEQRRQQFVSDFVYRTTALNQNGGFYKLPLGWCSDYLTSHILAQNYGIAHTNKLLFNYRSHSVSITSTGNIENKTKAIQLYMDWIEDFLSNTPEEELLLIKHSMLKKSLNKFLIGEKLALIRSTVVKRNLLKGFINYFKIKKKYNLKFKHLIGGFASSFYLRALRD